MLDLKADLADCNQLIEANPGRTHDRRSPEIHARTGRSARTRSRHSSTKQLEGWIPELASDEDSAQALEKAFDYRGDVTLTLKSGERIEAYIFNRQTGATLADSCVQYFTPKRDDKRKVSYAEIARLEFSGKDRAAGKHWEDWVKAYNEKKAAGEKNIALHPERWSAKQLPSNYSCLERR